MAQSHSSQQSGDAVDMALTSTSPSNLPADICDTPGTSDLTVEAGTSKYLFPGVADTCDARIPQEPPLLPICIRKFANVTIAGQLLVESQNVAVAIVATDTFTVAG
ncbi:hypothetical protein LVJ94_26975 [Pendulispora rubella]|uniref:Uncharacterized protein n=1 Tax=Pendulispora rubella TaxID=2741070 RepID=A0ABZ2KTC2_9BACT